MVLDKYPEGNVWLGPNGWRCHTAPGEWPVSYHGTSFTGAEGIISSHYKAGDRELYGRGVYSTPHLQKAALYADVIQSNKTGKTYKIVLQNWINPNERKVTASVDYWLIPIPSGTSDAMQKKIVDCIIIFTVYNY